MLRCVVFVGAAVRGFCWCCGAWFCRHSGWAVFFALRSVVLAVVVVLVGTVVVVLVGTDVVCFCYGSCFFLALRFLFFLGAAVCGFS